MDFPGWNPRQKGKVDQEGSKVMLVVQGLPIGVLVESAHVGRPKIRPKEVRAIDTLRWKLRARGSNLAFLGGR